MPKMVILMHDYRLWGQLEPVAVLKLSVAFRKAYNTGTLQVCFFSIDIYRILLHVKFEDVSSIAVLKKTDNSPQKFTTGNRKVSK
jgi:phenylalanine-4-hydroxylase